jgi:uncharacterized protein
MLVKIEEIQEGGLELNAPVSRVVFDEAFAGAEGFAWVANSTLAVSFKRVSGQVHVRGSMTAEVTGPCKRCVRPVALTVPVQFSLRMVRELSPPDQEDDEAADRSKKGKAKREREEEEAALASFDLDEIDAEPFDGKTIDLDPIVREQVLLALPVSVLCRDACQGLCAQCGHDLNESDCGHGRVKEVDPRLAKLAQIKLKN